jgi:hypothetical protein
MSTELEIQMPSFALEMVLQGIAGRSGWIKTIPPEARGAL